MYTDNVFVQLCSVSAFCSSYLRGEYEVLILSDDQKFRSFATSTLDVTTRLSDQVQLLLSFNTDKEAYISFLSFFLPLQFGIKFFFSTISEILPTHLLVAEIIIVFLSSKEYK